MIVGGGFGGLYCAQSFRRAPVKVTLLDRRNFHLFQPLLYQVATGGLSPANIAAPLRSVLQRQKNVEVLLGEVCRLDLAARRVLLCDGSSIAYDSLIVAAGSETSYFGHDDWESLAPGLKTIENATDIRGRVLSAFETAERLTDPEQIRQWLTFVVVGGGPTGVELAGALAEIARHTLRNDFRRINPSLAQIFILEGSDRVLQAYAPDLSEKAKAVLEDLGVTVRTNAIVTEVRPQSIVFQSAGQTETIHAGTMLWAAGVKASPLGKILAEAAGIETDRQGRVPVNADLSVPGHPELFVIGDLAHFSDPSGTPPLPALAPVAMQEGRYVAKLVCRRLKGESTTPFRYRDYGVMATIGRARAVATIGRFKLCGFLAWVLWLFVHLMYIVEFEKRLLVLFQWAWNYFTWNRSARLITGEKRIIMKATQTLHQMGQSLWLDNLSRGLLTSGTLHRYIQEFAVTGLTSNPTIFNHAIKNSHDYDDAIRRKVKDGKSGEALFFELALEDIREAADLFRPIHDKTKGVDGWVSLEVSPLLAHDTSATIAMAKELHARAERPNVLIKIPGTKEGLPAVEESVFAGVPVNVTLLFSREQYVAAAEAYLRGIERRIAAGLDPDVGSVASLFVSRWDVAVASKVPEELRNLLGLAVAEQTYVAYRALADSPPWQRVLNAGARRQRLLWASTGTKDPKAADILYVRALAAPFTVNTMPEPTLLAFADHGEVGPALPMRAHHCEEVLARFSQAGIDLPALAARLQDEGAAAFVKSWNELMECIVSKSAALEEEYSYGH